MDRQIVFTEKAPKPIGPYSQAVLVKGTLYVSGQIAMDPQSGSLIQGSIKEETHQVFNNIKAILEKAGFGFEDVVKASVFLKDMDTFPEMNEIYNDFFKSIKPARETIEVSRLPKDVNIEISLIAVR